MKMKIQIYTISVLLIMFSPFVYAAGFDCAKAQTKIERLICNDPQLSALDEKLVHSYDAVLQGHENIQPLREHQRAWLIDIRDRCQDTKCLRAVYEKRLAQLDVPLTFSPDACSKPESTPTIGYCLGSQLELEQQHLAGLMDALIVSRSLTESQANSLRKVQSSWQENLRCHCYDEADRNNGPGTGWSIAVGACELREISVRITEVRKIFSGATLDYGGNSPKTCHSIKSALEANPEYQLVSAVQHSRVAEVSRLLDGGVR